MIDYDNTFHTMDMDCDGQIGTINNSTKDLGCCYCGAKEYGWIIKSDNGRDFYHFCLRNALTLKAESVLTVSQLRHFTGFQLPDNGLAFNFGSRLYEDDILLAPLGFCLGNDII